MSALTNAGKNIVGTKSLSGNTKKSTFKSKPSLVSSNNNSKMSNDSFKEQFEGRNRKDFINEANKIMRERMKNRGSTINSKSKFKSVVLLDTKEICLKNYLISLLKDKRTDINEKERNIAKALRDSENRLDADYKEFIDFVEKSKKTQKSEEEVFLSLKSLHEQKENLYKAELADHKKLNEELERIVKFITILKGYGTFVNKVIKQPFWFSDIPEVDQRERNFEYVAQVILEKYQNLQDTGQLENLKDDEMLIHKFKDFEDKVIKILENKEVVDKEIVHLKESNDDEINELKRRYNDCLLEQDAFNQEKREIIQEIKKLNPERNTEIEMYLNYIIDLGMETGNIKQHTKGKKNFLDCLNFTQETLKALEQKEKIINDYIEEIENIELTGDKKLIKDIEAERKKENKREKQLVKKQKQDELEALKRAKADERNKRVVIKGRKVPKEYPILKEKKKKKDDPNKNKNNDLEMLYYSSDEN